MSNAEAKERINRILKGNTSTISSTQFYTERGMNEEDIKIVKELLFDLIDKIIK